MTASTTSTHGLPPILLEAQGTMVLDKPPGVSTQMRVDPEGVSIIEQVRRAGFDRAELPHRLDRMSSGILVVGLDRNTLRFHNESIRDKLWTKIYVARVARPKQLFKLLGPKKVHMNRRGRSAEIVQSGGKVARMEVLAIADVPGEHTQADLVVALDTGRFHQIRATLASLKAPVAGDALYGNAAEVQPMLRQVLLRLPMPAVPAERDTRVAASWHLVRADPVNAGESADQELTSYLDKLAAQLEPNRPVKDAEATASSPADS